MNARKTLIWIKEFPHSPRNGRPVMQRSVVKAYRTRASVQAQGTTRLTIYFEDPRPDTEGEGFKNDCSYEIREIKAYQHGVYSNSTMGSDIT